MAEYLTNTTELTKVASAIREKGGTSDSLVFPDGFVSAISAIKTGGGSGGGGSSQTGVVDTSASYTIIYTYFPDTVSVTVPTRVVTATSASGELQT